EVDAEHLGQPALAYTVAVGIGKLGAFLEVDHEIDGDAGIPRPLGMGRLGAVTDEVACHDCSPSLRDDSVQPQEPPADQSAKVGPTFTAAASRAARRITSASGAHNINMIAPKVAKLSLVPQRSAIQPISGGIMMDERRCPV